VGRSRVERWFGLRRAFDARMDSLSDRWGANLIDEFNEAERHARSALQAVCNAYNYLDDLTYDYEGYVIEVRPGEDRPLEEVLDHCHHLVHRYGELVGGLFGCPVEYKDDDWYDTCVVSLLHLRFGNSAGFTARYICAVCGEGAGDCHHNLGDSYPLTAGLNADGYCDICEDECEAHKVGSIYETEAGYRITDAMMQEVSLVRRPRDPLTRITHRSVNPERLIDRLGRLPEPGEPVLCHSCLYPCEGFRHLGD
jgi:hypothetical protein